VLHVVAPVDFVAPSFQDRKRSQEIGNQGRSGGSEAR
jgi:hypothetical protein